MMLRVSSQLIWGMVARDGGVQEALCGAYHLECVGLWWLSISERERIVLASAEGRRAMGSAQDLSYSYIQGLRCLQECNRLACSWFERSCLGADDARSLSVERKGRQSQRQVNKRKVAASQEIHRTRHTLSSNDTRSTTL